MHARTCARGLRNSGCVSPPNGANTSWLNDSVVNRTSELANSTFDLARRKAFYQEEEERVHQLVPAQFFYWENEYTAVNSDLKNFRPATFIQDPCNAWQWQI